VRGSDFAIKIAKLPPLPLWERVGVRGVDFAIEIATSLRSSQ
jgi:uncharacterized membrane protein YqaE (UPF0057 family)